MDYEVFVSVDAEKDLDNFLQYLLLEKKNEQAAKNLLDDFEITKQCLTHVAGSLKYCMNPKLRELGYKRINFTAHRYFMLYRVIGNRVIIDNIFHELQDYENKLSQSASSQEIDILKVRLPGVVKKYGQKIHIYDQKYGTSSVQVCDMLNTLEKEDYKIAIN